MLDRSELHMNLTQMDLESLWHPMVQHKTYEQKPPKRMDKGVGCYVTDEQGQEYLEAVSGLWCVNVGYGRRELAEAARANGGTGLFPFDNEPFPRYQTSG